MTGAAPAHTGRGWHLLRKMYEDWRSFINDMTALVLTAIPNTINTYERLAVWAIQCLQSSSNGEQIVVVNGQGQQMKAQCQVGTIDDGSLRFLLSAYVPCNLGELNNPTAKTWMAAGDLSTAEPHLNLRSN